jgi:ferredoxin
MRIVVDVSRCCGLGMCEAEAPDLFEVRTDGSLTVRNDRPGEGRRAAVEEAVAVCPTQALSIAEDGARDGAA